MTKMIWIFALMFPSLAFAQAGPVGAGRYIIVHSPHVQRDTVLLDTATGKTWQLVSLTDREGDPAAWAPMARVDNPVERAEFMRDHPAKP
ncbi:MAG: hypothetical protein ACLGIM_17750 [Alphaproteobacteria bacterium]|jgi:hypothetical protein